MAVIYIVCIYIVCIYIYSIYIYCIYIYCILYIYSIYIYIYCIYIYTVYIYTVYIYTVYIYIQYIYKYTVYIYIYRDRYFAILKPMGFNRQKVEVWASGQLVFQLPVDVVKDLGRSQPLAVGGLLKLLDMVCICELSSNIG